ncbi:MAG: endonuclease [Saprospiraceae bacterium]
MARQAALLFFAFGVFSPLRGQIFTPVFPSLNGSALYQAVVGAYKPVVVLDYANARDTLYAKVLAKDDDSLRCIYSGYTLYLDPTQDPTQYIYLGGSPLGMNTEHTYPQAKGAADGNARSDMHHLFPARIPVNEARGNLPFAEIPDPQTLQWFYQAQVFTSIPTQNIHLYSEGKASAFEPREPVKGDLARAIFYFYTMYTTEAMAADPDFFALQRPTLCQWHDQDRADSAELIKTLRIAPYQENKPNPFVLDCTLARRMYCPELSSQCQTTGVVEPTEAALGLRVLPNPLRGEGQVEVILPFSGDLKFRLLSLLGQEIFVWDARRVGEGQFRFSVQAPHGHAGGLTWLEVSLLHEGRMVRQTVPVVLLSD